MTTTPQPPVVPGPDQPDTLGNLRPLPTRPPSQSPAPLNRTSAWIALGAGVAVVIGSFLPWASITAPILGTVTVSGTDGSDGWITAAAGSLLALYGGATLRRRIPAAVGVLAALAGLGVTGVAVWKIVELRSRITDMRTEMAQATEGDELGFASALADAVHARIGPGLWLLVAAGLVAAISIGHGVLRRNDPEPV